MYVCIIIINIIIIIIIILVVIIIVIIIILWTSRGYALPKITPGSPDPARSHHVQPRLAWPPFSGGCWSLEPKPFNINRVFFFADAHALDAHCSDGAETRAYSGVKMENTYRAACHWRPCDLGLRCFSSRFSQLALDAFSKHLCSVIGQLSQRSHNLTGQCGPRTNRAKLLMQHFAPLFPKFPGLSPKKPSCFLFCFASWNQHLEAQTDGQNVSSSVFGAPLALMEHANRPFSARSIWS